MRRFSAEVFKFPQGKVDSLPEFGESESDLRCLCVSSVVNHVGDLLNLIS